MIGIPLGLLYANAGEWFIHKYLLHGLGKKKDGFWSFHWHEHHRNVRKNDHYDEAYARPIRGWNAKTKELAGIVATAVAHAPLFPVAPFFVGTVWYCGFNYYRVHKRAHLDTAWAKANVPWHYDHHMGPDQHANWCVTRPFFDQVMGTRKPYLGTAKAQADEVKRTRRGAPKPAAA